MAKRQVEPPRFVMWKSIPRDQQLGWERHWFGNELNPSAVFNVRGLGLKCRFERSASRSSLNRRITGLAERLPT
jgi:hypothetical protein